MYLINFAVRVFFILYAYAVVHHIKDKQNKSRCTHQTNWIYAAIFLAPHQGSEMARRIFNGEYHTFVYSFITAEDRRFTIIL